MEDEGGVNNSDVENSDRPDIPAAQIIATSSSDPNPRSS
jgi:hypothetical protein